MMWHVILGKNSEVFKFFCQQKFLGLESRLSQNVRHQALILVLIIYNNSFNFRHRSVQTRPWTSEIVHNRSKRSMSLNNGLDGLESNGDGNVSKMKESLNFMLFNLDVFWWVFPLISFPKSSIVRKSGLWIYGAW